MGNVEADLARMRGECTLEIEANLKSKDLLDTIHSENSILRSHVRDCRGEQHRTETISASLQHEAGGLERTLEGIESNVAEIE